VSSRRLDADIRAALIDSAARLFSEAGPAALSTRRLAAQAGTSTMAIYTHFGSMSELIREITREGFARLAGRFEQVEQTEDAVADMACLGRVYRHNATMNRYLYSVMFGGDSLRGFALSEADRQNGRYTLSPAIDCARRCIETGRFRHDDPVLVAHQMWLGIHGTVTLEIGRYLIDPWPATKCFEAQLVNLMVGAGDSLASARRSVAASAERFAEEPAPGDSNAELCRVRQRHFCGQMAETAIEEQQRLFRRAVADRLDQADEDGVIAAVVDGGELAFQPGERVAEDGRGGVRSDSHVNSGELPDARPMVVGEHTRLPLLVRGEYGHRERAGLVDRIVQVGGSLHAHEHQRRIERHRAERVGRHAMRLGPANGHHGDPGPETT
jgi:AcrR family transcriptional regulator